MLLKKTLTSKSKDDFPFFLLLVDILDDKACFCLFAGGQRTNKRDRIEETIGTGGEEYSMESTLWKRLSLFPSRAGMSLTKLSMAGNN